ncbi:MULTISPECIES: UTP--glucose-1-phosphate uridylyltransferase GalU [unclassified Fusibacter]|uniref:UTP--glucose-1-phosphate uridylyltransferase GalU n=1 Tax=unclassified Fusibacter TaxID=2624464 RepID=UPI00101193A9|nr:MULTISPECIES: UTP--glucose-1-phosphate uridylyltransferase GalU [unclassified Fusibacter]MCK8060421.1 UTP--glucose-1-phosphate uridylyltransferase GalU [Fusibacter sp. A2]NPE20290.1 UTP--glucose-1-phosphate uridylyltransferase GalU [Fusibacter sp. A1]RXV63496.1 UTP--glucose-1-phosphate uridylyltransferase [Fusibacter sp. A1]
MKITKAVIPAAGLGTRFLPATKAQPKEMLPIVDKPTIQYIVEEAVAAGIEDIIIITGRGKHAIENHFDRNIELELRLQEGNKLDQLATVQASTGMANIHYIRQIDPKGLGHAILCAKHFIGNEPFAVLLGDDVVVSEQPAIGQLINQYEAMGGTVLGVQQVELSEVSKYGIIDKTDIDARLGRVNDMVEKPKQEDAPSQTAVLGRYVISPSIFKYLEDQTPGAGGEIQLTDALKRQAKDEAVYAYNFSGKRYDIGHQLGFVQATLEFALRRAELKEDVMDYLKEFMQDPEGHLNYK